MKKVYLVSVFLIALLSGCYSYEGMTPLMLAAKSGNVQKLNELVERDADVDQTSQYGWTALMFASWQGHEQIVEKLLDAGADPNIVSKYIPSYFETVGGYSSSTALTEAVIENHTSIANLLIDRGAQIDPKAIAYAGGKGNIPLLEKFLEKGASLNQPTKDVFNPSPLCSASREGKIDTVKWLIDHDANPNLIAIGHTALGDAVKGNHPEVVRYLLDNGTDPNIVYGEHWWPTALFQAVDKATNTSNYERNYTIIEILLRHGADKSYRSEKYGTALDFIKLQRSNTVKYVEKQEKMDTDILKSFQMDLKHMDAIIELLAK